MIENARLSNATLGFALSADGSFDGPPCGIKKWA